jgi:serine/threonine protein kinase
MLGLAKAIREGGEEVLCGVSDATGTSYERLARIAAGTSEWYGFELGRIADALGCSMYEAATGEPPAEYDPSDGPAAPSRERRIASIRATSKPTTRRRSWAPRTRRRSKWPATRSRSPRSSAP